jgi:hypothetical protein
LRPQAFENTVINNILTANANVAKEIVKLAVDGVMLNSFEKV